MMKRPLAARSFILLLSLSLVFTARADDVHVAVASNFTATLKQIAARFESQTKHHLIITPDSTGKLYAQIKNGAPFEIFLSADMERPRQLEKDNLATPGKRFTYAIGKLVLWSADPKFVDAEGSVLKKGEFRHLAIANPKLAPYGAAVKEVLEGMHLWEKLQPKIVQGENIAQTFQFIETGNAELGFIALSQLIEMGRNKGSSWLVPPAQHHPIEQQAVLLKKSEERPAARAFIEFLKGKEARVIIQADGYQIP